MARLVSSESLKCSRIELMITNWYSFSPIEWQFHELNIFFTKWYQISRCASSFHHLKIHIHQMTDFTKWIFTKWFHQGAFTQWISLGFSLRISHCYYIWRWFQFPFRFILGKKLVSGNLTNPTAIIDLSCFAFILLSKFTCYDNAFKSIRALNLVTFRNLFSHYQIH